MNTLYVIRHGECEHNAEGRIAAQNDSSLTALGREQARANGVLLKRIAGDLSQLDFYASSLHRTCMTMELLREAAGLPATGYRADRRLMEIDLGDHTWCKWRELTSEERAQYRADPWHHHYRGAESHADVYARVGEFLATLKRDSVIVSHAVPTRLIRAHYLGLSPEDAVRYEHPHAGLMRLAAGAETYFGE
ncbi:MAG: histidine phosphatase family protein [Rhizomicrobium sp.]